MNDKYKIAKGILGPYIQRMLTDVSWLGGHALMCLSATLITFNRTE